MAMEAPSQEDKQQNKDVHQAQRLEGADAQDSTELMVGPPSLEQKVYWLWRIVVRKRQKNSWQVKARAEKAFSNT